MRRLIFLGILACLIIIVYFMMDSPKERISIKEEIDSDLELQRFSLIETQGTFKKWSLTSKRAVVYGERAKLEDIELKFFDKAGPILTLFADCGTLDRKTHLIKADYKVVVKGRDGSVLTAPTILWNLSNELITTQGRFTLKKDKVRIRGEGLRMDPRMERIEAKELVQDKPISIKANKVVWDKVKEVIFFEGDVVIVHDNKILTADEVKGFGKIEAPAKFIAKGNAKVVDPKTKTTITSGYIEYNAEAGYIIFKDNPLLLNEGEDPLKVSSSLLKYLFEDERIHAKGEVVIHYLDLVTYSDMAHYGDGRLLLTGNPKIKRSNMTFSGDKITIYTEEDRMEIIGDVKATFLIQERGDDVNTSSRGAI